MLHINWPGHFQSAVAFLNVFKQLKGAETAVREMARQSERE